MNEAVQKKLDHIKDVLREARKYIYATGILTFDQETICPFKGMQEEGEVAAFLGNQAYQLLKEESFLADAEALYQERDELEEFDRVLVEALHREDLKNRNVTPKLQHEFALVYNKAFVDWSKARGESDFSLFQPSLEQVFDISKKSIELREEDPDAPRKKILYDHMLDDFERGMTSEVLDRIFDRCKERLLPFLKKIAASKKKIRTDFLSRPVTDEQQRQAAEYLLQVMNYDFSRGAFTTTEHPFTNGIGKNDVRVTTHYYPDQFLSSMYSIIHEGGHALLDQFQPEKNFDHFIEREKSLGMHESVSRFYENRIGRSREYISLIFPRIREIFSDILSDVSEEEFYEAVNTVTPSLIRTEADEFTYTLHVIIRYEVEKALFAGEVLVPDIPKLWKEKYEEYLGIVPSTDREGVLQDVHWTFGFGYFPTYALGNFYNAMYINRMKEEIDLFGSVKKGDFETINAWMTEHVFSKADRLAPADWIKDITGRELTPDDFLDYLEEKYGGLYGV